MSGYTGAYTRGGNPEAMFSEDHLYLEMLAQTELAAIDSDFNDIAFSRLRQLRRIIFHAIGNGTNNSGFQIVQSSLSTANNFTIKGGDGTDDGAGRMFVNGYPCFLKSDVDFTGTYNAEMTKVSPMVTGVASTVLTDSAANWTTNEHAGKTLIPDISNPGTTFTILSNTANTITVTAPDLTTATALYKFYRIVPSTPGSPRTDCVYLDVFYDEQNATEDPNFVNPDLTPPQSGPLRIILRQYVRVKEGQATPPPAFVDSNGRQHYTVALAVLQRPASANILTANIVDVRRIFALNVNSGPASWFQPNPQNPASNTIRVRGGVGLLGGMGVLVPGSPAFSDLPTSTFAPVSASGKFRYDLVYIDNTGTPQILQGTEQTGANPVPFAGAPGWTGATPGPAIPDQANPVAWVLIDETGTANIIAQDITAINGMTRVTRDFMGFYIDKGNTSSVPASGSQDVSSSFTTEVAGGGATALGIITSPPSNVVHLVDQNGNEIAHVTTNTPIYGKITFSNPTWTLSYFYLNAGVETAVADMATDSTLGAGLTAIHMAFVPKVYSLNDPNRPLFPSSAVPLNGLIPGEIPLATTSAPGIVQLAVPTTDTTAGHAVQANDGRLGKVTGAYNVGVGGGATPLGSGSATAAKRGTINFIPSTNIAMTIYDDPTNDSIDVVISASAGGSFPGFGGTPPADSGSGSGGSSGLASQSNHVHPLSGSYQLTASGTYGTTTLTTNIAFPRLAVGVWNDGTGIGGVGVAVGSGSGLIIQMSDSGGRTVNGNFGNSTNGSISFTAFTNGSQSLSGNTWTAGYGIIGQTGF